MTEKRSEAFKELQPTLDQYAGVKGSLITILQKAQEIYGYLSKDCINLIQVNIFRITLFNPGSP